MFVDPTFRRIDAGRAILEGLLVESKKAGYKNVRLSSPKFMEAAHWVYRNFVFHNIEAYPEMKIPTEFEDFFLFMEMDLRMLHYDKLKKNKNRGSQKLSRVGNIKKGK